MSHSKSLEDSSNIAVIKMLEEYKKEIFQAAVIYNKFSPSDKDNFEINDAYMIGKDFLDNFKSKINYDGNNQIFKEDTDENLENFKKQLKPYGLKELEEIIFEKIKIYGDLDDIEDDINKGFEFVNGEFLEKMEVELEDENNNINFKEDNKVKYIKNGKNELIIFSDLSKLLIFTDNGVKKYHAIPAPVSYLDKTKNKIKLRRSSTIFVSRRKGKTVVFPRGTKEV